LNMVKRKILAVDDEPSFTRMLKRNLERTGAYEVEEENLGTRCLSTARRFHPDLILLDIIMPDVEGHFLLSQFKTDQTTRSIPIVFLTATLTKEEMRKNKGALEGVPALAKPVDMRLLLSCIEKYLKK